MSHSMASTKICTNSSLFAGHFSYLHSSKFTIRTPQHSFDSSWFKIEFFYSFQMNRQMHAFKLTKSTLAHQITDFCNSRLKIQLPNDDDDDDDNFQNIELNYWEYNRYSETNPWELEIVTGIYALSAGDHWRMRTSNDLHEFYTLLIWWNW